MDVACEILSGSDKAGLGDALKQIETKDQLCPKMKGALNPLYGYASDEGSLTPMPLKNKIMC